MSLPILFSFSSTSIGYFIDVGDKEMVGGSSITDGNEINKHLSNNNSIINLGKSKNQIL